MSDSKIKSAAEALTALSESVPVYRDGVQPGMVQVGKAVETVGKAVNVALAPLRLVVWGYEQIEGYLVDRVGTLLADVPQDRIVSPDLNVAGPAVEAMKFAGHKPELREMYAKLLAASMDADTAVSAHPAFVEVIRQLTPDEAKVLALFCEMTEIPMVLLGSKHLKEEELSVTYQISVVRRNFSLCGYEADCEHPQLSSIYLDNLDRLKLIRLEPNEFIDRDVYSPLEEHPEIADDVAEIEATPDREVHFQKGVAMVTDFGKAFCSVCIAPHPSRAV